MTNIIPTIAIIIYTIITWSAIFLLIRRIGF